MSIFKRFFGKKDVFFEIAVDVIKYPEKWSQEIDELVKILTDAEKKQLIKVCGILDEHLEHLHNFWTETDFTINKLNNDNSILYKSCFELLMIDWCLISREMNKQQNRNEVGQTLWWVIYWSTISYSSALFSKTTYENIEVAFENRSQLYPKILMGYFSGDESRNNVSSQNMYTLLICTPLTNDTSNLENETLGSPIINGRMDPMNFRQNMTRAMIFNRVFSEGITKLLKDLNKIGL